MPVTPAVQVVDLESTHLEMKPIDQASECKPIYLIARERQDSSDKYDNQKTQLAHPTRTRHMEDH